MYLDKENKELVLKIVFAGEGKHALEEVSLLASQVRPAASSVISLLDDAVRMSKIRFPGIQVRGMALRAEVDGVSIDGLRAKVGEAEADRTTLVSDGLIFVVGPGQSGARATFEHLRSGLRIRGLNGAKTPFVVLATGTVEGTELAGTDVPIAAGPGACVVAMKTVIKEIVQEVVRGLGE